MTADTVVRLLSGKHSTYQAIGAPGGRSLSYGGLATLTRDARTTLAASGIGRDNRVAIVLPNGP